MALPPHFGGIENEARNCNIYHHRLQNTPIKILLHQITIIFRTVVILTNLFTIFTCKAPLGFWVSWNFEELAAMNSMTDPGPGSKARFPAVEIYSSQFPSFKFPFKKRNMPSYLRVVSAKVCLPCAFFFSRHFPWVFLYERCFVSCVNFEALETVSLCPKLCQWGFI